MQLFFSSIFLNLVTIIIFYFIGTFTLSVFKLNNRRGFSQYFFALLCGFLLTVTVYAIIITGFATTLLATLPVIIWGLLKRNDLLESNTEISGKHSKPLLLFISLAMLTIITSLFFYKYIGFSNPANSISWFHADNVLYANVAAHLNDNGHENYLFHTDSKSILLYHYTEMWLTALLNKICGGTYILTFIFQTLPVIFFILWVGFMAVAESFIKSKSFLFYLTVSLFCFIAAPLAEMFFPFKKILKGDLFDLTFTLYYKLAIIQLFVVAIVVARNNINSIIGISLLLAIFYPVTFPAIYVTLYFYLLFDIIKNKNISREKVNIIVASLSSFAIFVSLLMVFKDTSVVEEKSDFFKTYIGDFSNYIRTAINIAGSSVINIVVSFLPYLILGFFIRKQFDKSFWLIALLLVFVQFIGLIAWAALSSMPDSVQLWSNIYSCVINTIIFILVLFGITDKRILVKAFVVWIIVANAWFHYPVSVVHHDASPGELAIIEKVKAVKDPTFVFLRDPSEFKNIFMLNTNFAIPAVYLAFYVDSYKPACINSDSVAQDYWGKKYFNYSPFMVFTKNNNQPFEKMQEEYIRSNQIDFLIASTNAEVPVFITHMTDTIIHDETNDLRLYVLNNNNR